MSDKKETLKQDSGKVKVDADKVIKTKPVMIRENFCKIENRNKPISDISKKKKKNK